MENILLYIAAGIVTIIGLFWLVCNLVKIAKMSNDEKRKVLITYLQGAVALAEKEIGAGKGDEKLASVEKYFNEKAPMFYKIILRIAGAGDLKGLIEEALKDIKQSFGGNK